jgi:hypothetical protein
MENETKPVESETQAPVTTDSVRELIEEVVAKYGLTDLENRAVSEWMAGGFSDMNRLIHSPEKVPDRLKEPVSIANKIAISALEKLPPVTAEQLKIVTNGDKDSFDENRPLRRDIYIPDPDKFVDAYQESLEKGTPFTEKTFFGTTTKDEKQFSQFSENGNVQYEITAKLDGTGRGRSIDNFYGQEFGEGEVLFAPNSKFKVTGIEKTPGEDGKWKIKLQEA